VPIAAIVSIPALLLAMILSSVVPLPENQVSDDRLVEVLNMAGDPAEAGAARSRLERDLDDASADLRFTSAFVLVSIDPAAAYGRAGAVLRAAAAKPDTIHTGILASLSEGTGVTEALEPVYLGILTDRSPVDPAQAALRAHRRRLAVAALARLPLERRPAMAAALRPALLDGETETRIALADLLREYGPVAAAAAPELRANLAATDVSVRGASAAALWRIEGRRDPALARAVSEVLASVPAAMRASAISWIEDMGGAVPAASAFLMAAANDPDSEVSFVAAAALTQPGVLSAIDFERLVDAPADRLPMLPMLLARLGERAWPAILRGLEHGTPGVAAAYAAVLHDARVPATRAVPQLVQRLGQERERFARASFAGALAKYGAEASASRPALIDMLAGGDAFEASAAATALHAIGGPVPVDRIVAQLRSPVPFQRRIAADLLRTLQTPEPAAGQALVAALTDPDSHAREAVAAALSFIDAARYPQALPVLEAALADADVAHQPGDPLVQAVIRHGAAAVPTLMRLAANGHSRSTALTALTMMPAGTPGVTDALKTMAASGDLDGRSAAAMGTMNGHLTREEAAGDAAEALRSADPGVRLFGVTQAMAGEPTPETVRQIRAIATDRHDPFWPFALIGLAERDQAFARDHVDDLARLLTIEPWMQASRATGVGAMSGDFTTMPAMILGQLGRDASAALPALKALAADRQPQTAVAARIAIARIEARPVQAMVDAAVADLSVGGQLTRIEAVLTLTYLGPEAAAALPKLEGLPSMGQTLDWLVKAAIAAIRGEAERR
jgi:hypothetical protein